MDRRQVCAQVLQSSLLPQAIGFYTLASRTPTYRHKRQIFTAISDWKKETAILLPQAIRPWNAAPATQKQQSPAALKNITCRSKKWTFLLPQAIGASYRHKRSTSRPMHLYQSDRSVRSHPLLNYHASAPSVRADFVHVISLFPVPSWNILLWQTKPLTSYWDHIKLTYYT